MTTVKKVSQWGLVTAAIMLALILAFYSLANAATPIVNIPCGQDIDARINADPRGTASRFVLGADCTFLASATIVPSNGDEVACAVAPTFVQRGPAFDPTTRCTVAGNSSVENVFRPIGQGGTTATVRFEGIKITGGNYTGSTGSGAAIAEGSMTNLSSHYGIEVMNNEAAGILSAKGTFERVEFTNNTLVSNALGVIGSGMKARNEVEVKNSYIHDTQGNGLWCDNFCEDSPTATHPKGFWVHHNLVVNNGRAGIRFERVGDVSTAGEALIEYNEVHSNSPNENRGGISVRDAQNATIQNNRFGEVTIGGVKYLANARNVAIIASDSGRSDRPNLFNIDKVNNTLNGEIMKGCELPDTIVACSGNTP
ncbi:MAG TPA: right-handed parallel beta-helix repeat-containing protein [Rubrobacter sp.]|nr:right-handed parallel beta-helix repeat-containing protein [Rubrobacter sp.]